GNTNLSLPGTQYVSYSGMNEGLFGLKASARTGPLDLTLLASRQEGRSERATFAGGTGKRDNSIMDVDYVRGVYFFLFDPNTPPRLIDEQNLHVYITPPTISADANLVRGRAQIDPSAPDTAAVRGNFRELTAGADRDFEIMRYYGPDFIVLRLRQPVDPRQCLAVTYPYRNVDGSGVPIGPVIQVGGVDLALAGGSFERSMLLVRPPEDQLVKETGSGLGSPTFYADTGAFNGTRELELKNIYLLGGQRIDPKTFTMSIRRGTDQPFVTSVQTAAGSIPYIEAVGLDNYDETSGTPIFGQHDGRVDGTAAGGNNQLHVAVDFDNGLLFLPDPQPFAPRLGSGGKVFDNEVAAVLSRRDTLTGAPDSTNGANPDIYRKYVNQGALDAEYYMDVSFTASSVGNDIQLGRGNILAGSEVVSVNGVTWKPNVDYTIDYDLGRVTLKRSVGPNDQLNIDYAYAPLFQQASQTLIGSAFHLDGRDKRMGGAFMYESRAAQDLRPRLGEEPSQSVIGDLNGDWLMHPQFLTRAADRLPGVRTTAPSDFHIQGEIGASFPNPNTKNVIYIDDMEGVRDAISLSMGPERWHWSSVPSRRVNGIPELINSLPSQHNAEVHWYSPPNVVKEKDLKPTLTQAEGGENTHQVLAISVPRRPVSGNSDFVNGVYDSLWVGLTYLLDPVGLDLSRSQFIELWVNDFNDQHDVRHPEPRVRGRHLKLHIDVGRVSEDMQRSPDVLPNGGLDSEDKNRDGQLQVSGDTYEDTGYDQLIDPGAKERPGGRENPDSLRDLTTASLDDPEGDTFRGTNGDFSEIDPRRYKYTNGTEDNKNLNPTPDTEDLNLNNNLDTNESYFEYTIDLGDTTAGYQYLAEGGDLQMEKANGTPGYQGVTGDNGWRRYRVPLADSLRKVFGIPDLTLAQHVRVWVEGIINPDPAADSLGAPVPPTVADNKNYPVRPLLMLGSLDIVASRWQVEPLDSNTTARGTTVTLNAVNTVDNSNVYTPPFDPGQTLNGSQSVTRREQSLAMEFTHLLPDDSISVFRTFSIDEDYTRYGKLAWYAAGFQIPGYVTPADSLYYFVRFSSDESERSYYEYRAPVPPSSSDRNIAWSNVLLRLTDLSNLKLAPDFPRADPTFYMAPGAAANETYVIKGRPSFTRVRRISVGLINASTNAAHVYETGQLWVDELRAVDVARDAGQAERVSIDGHIANLLGYNFSYDGRNADFISV
ncbi:MAG: cell surface protein SprA, partial [Candidatus Eiseniibacteriota bacterium]